MHGWVLWASLVPWNVFVAPAAGQGFAFTDIAVQSGLDFTTVSGVPGRKDYLLESTGSGVAIFDYDGDGNADLFFVNGSRFTAFQAGDEPTNHLYRNLGDGRFTDVTIEAGLKRSGWGQGVCVGDFDNDGFSDLFVSYYGSNVLYRNNGDGTFTDVTAKAGLPVTGTRWGTGAAFLDFNADGFLDLFVANYVDFDLEKTPERGEEEYCNWQGMPVFCGPRGLPGGENVLYRGTGHGTFVDVSQEAGIRSPSGYYCLGVVVSDFDNDGRPDIYVASDSTPNILYRNLGNGRFKDIAVLSGVAYNQDGKLQAGMGVSVSDYNHDGHFDIFKTNFSEDISTLYRNDGDGLFTDLSLNSGFAKNNRYLGWGAAFGDFNNDGWKDVVQANGHVYPEADGVGGRMLYAQPLLLYQGTPTGKFDDVTKAAGPGFGPHRLSRGLAIGDLDNDGTLEIVVNNMDQSPTLLRQPDREGNSVLIRTIGIESNRDGIGARVTVVAGGLMQTDEVRSGGSYLSHNDLRLHFGVGKATGVETLSVAWPGGGEEILSDLPVNHLIVLKQGHGVTETIELH